MIKNQPADLAFAPPSYPDHVYTGEGTIYVVRVGREVVGHLTRQGDAVGWDASAPGNTDAGIVRRMVSEALRMGAYHGRPLDEVFAEILASVQHDDPVIAPLDGLQG
jgi:hypothetical protein